MDCQKRESGKNWAKLSGKLILFFQNYEMKQC